MSRRSLQAANTELFEKHRIVEQMPRTAGGVFDWDLLQPNAWLAALVANSPGLQSLFQKALARSPMTAERPWRLVLGFDEFTPGNKHALETRRKNMVLSFTFLELGQEAISNGEAWFTPVVLRSNVITELQGGWSACLNRFLQHQLLGRDGLATGGVPLLIQGQHIALFARLSNLLSDGDGLRMALDWRGASSLKPCIKHYNVFKKDFQNRAPSVTHRDDQRLSRSLIRQSLRFSGSAATPIQRLSRYSPTEMISGSAAPSFAKRSPAHSTPTQLSTTLSIALGRPRSTATSGVLCFAIR